MGKKTAYGLIRVSTNTQELISQREELRKIAKKFEYEINDDDFFEEKITGYDEHEHDRDSILKLKQQISVRPPSAIFVLELSRLTRRAIKVSHYIDILSLQTHVPMYFADYDIWTIDRETGKPNDKGIMELYGGARGVEIERDRIKNRTCRGRDAKAKRGLFVGHLTDGYKSIVDNDGEKVIVVDDNRAEVIKNIFDLYLNKEMSASEIRDWLIANEIPTTNKYRTLHPELFSGYKKEYKNISGNIFNRENALWSSNNICQILGNEWYIGKRKYKNEIYKVPAIISQDVFDKVQVRLSKFRSNVSTARNSYILNGMLFCGKCGRKMYAHTDEYNNMYYCSSQEYGKLNRCGLRWIRQQNLDAIVFDIIKIRSINDSLRKDKSPFSSFFDINRDEIRKIDEKISTYRSLYEIGQNDINNFKKELEYHVGMVSKYLSQPDILAVTESRIQKINNDIESVKSKCIEYQIQEEKLKKEKKGLLSLKDKLEAIDTMSDFNTIKALVKSVVSKVQVFNPDKTVSLIKIHYVNNRYDIVLYAPRMMRKKYILLNNYDVDWHLFYKDNESFFTFPEHYLAIKSNEELLFDTSEEIDENYDDLMLAQGELLVPRHDTQKGKERYIASVKNSKKLGYIDEDEAKIQIKFYDRMVENGMICKSFTEYIEKLKKDGYLIYKDSISVVEYVNLRKKGTFLIHDFDDLEPMSEKGIQRKEYNKQYHKSKNKGTSSSVQWIVKDVFYEEILKKRKRLYNQRYKAVNNKKISEAERAERLMKIDEQLEVLRYQVKYMPTNAKGKKHIKKYNNSNNES